MRTRFVICLLVFLACALAIVFWLRPMHDATIAVQIQGTIPTNSIGLADKPNSASQSVAHAPESSNAPADQQAILAHKAETPEQARQEIESENSSIEFYGKVIDQDSNPVPGAKIDIGIRHWTLPNPAILLAGSTLISLEQISDANGRFEFHGATGYGFGVGITKDGYELEQSKHGSGPTAGSYSEPVIFKMWSTNIHEKLITGNDGFKIVPDGRTYIINLADNTIAESGTGDLRVWIQYTNHVMPGQVSDWSAGIAVINGGLLEETLGSPMFQAPAEGYMPTFETHRRIRGGQRGSTGERQFYLRLRNGQEYRQMSIGLYAPFNGQTPGLIHLCYAINPSGSSILR